MEREALHCTTKLQFHDIFELQLGGIVDGDEAMIEAGSPIGNFTVVIDLQTCQLNPFIFVDAYEYTAIIRSLGGSQSLVDDVITTALGDVYLRFHKVTLNGISTGIVTYVCRYPVVKAGILTANPDHICHITAASPDIFLDRGVKRIEQTHLIPAEQITKDCELQGRTLIALEVNPRTLQQQAQTLSHAAIEMLCQGCIKGICKPSVTRLVRPDHLTTGKNTKGNKSMPTVTSALSKKMLGGR